LKDCTPQGENHPKEVGVLVWHSTKG
jgi:hypothetical protein